MSESLSDQMASVECVVFGMHLILNGGHQNQIGYILGQIKTASFGESELTKLVLERGILLSINCVPLLYCLNL